MCLTINISVSVYLNITAYKIVCRFQLQLHSTVPNCHSCCQARSIPQATSQEITGYKYILHFL